MDKRTVFDDLKKKDGMVLIDYKLKTVCNVILDNLKTFTDTLEITIPGAML